MNELTVIRLDVSGPIADVVLDRPAKLNAMAPVFFDELRAVFDRIEQDREIRAVVLRAEGPHFTAGLDLEAAAPDLRPDPEAARSPVTANQKLYRLIRGWQRAVAAPERCRVPVIAAVHGHCIGGGVDLATACDVRLAAADATFSIHETKIAIVADLGTLQRIGAIVGKGMAREMAFTGARMPAERALRCGLVNEVYPDRDRLLEAAHAMAEEIAANSPLAVEGTKRVLRYSEAHSIEEGLEHVAQWNASYLHSQDLVEALHAFRERRPPRFVGR